MEQKSQKIAMRVSAVSIIVNVLLSLFKFFAGIAASSGAMISDAVHSASDVFSTFIVIAGVKISGRASDEGHQYGHERMECVASLLLAVILFAIGAGIGFGGAAKIYGRSYGDLPVPGTLALWAAAISIFVKEWMYWYTRTAAKKINSGALMAEAWHHRSDSLSSIGAFAGIQGARMGHPILDPAASVVICLFIMKAALDIFLDAVNKMVDKSCDRRVTDRMRQMIQRERGVLAVDCLKTRLFGSKIYVEIEIAADGSRTLNETHEIADRVSHRIEGEFPEVKHCTVQVNPVLIKSRTFVHN